MGQVLREIGINHKPNEYTVNWELNLDDLWFLESIIPLNDSFRKDVYAAIEKVESANKARAESQIAFSKHFEERASPLLKLVVRSMYL